MSEMEWRTCLDLLAELPKNYCILSGSIPPGVPDDFYARAARIAKERGARVLLDAAGETLKSALEEGVYLVKPNLNELMGLAEGLVVTLPDWVRLAQSLVRAGKANIVALSLGHEGALLVSDDETLRLRAPSVPTRSVVGAGDSFLGGFVVGLVRGWSATAAFRLAMAAGAAALLTPGTELCRSEDVMRLYDETRWEDLAEKIP